MPTAYEIYQTYLKGPAAIIHLFEQALGSQAIYGQPSPDFQQRTIDTQAAEIDRLQTRIARLQQELGTEQHLNFQLTRRNSELEARLVKDSHNSSRPPSSDHPAVKRTRSLRRPSGKRPGGQLGHPGHTRPLVAHPSRVVFHRPPKCRRCQSPLTASQLIWHEKRQVIELIPQRLRVTEHRAEVRRCQSCGARTKGKFPPEVRAAVQYGASVKARALYFLQYQLLPYARVGEVMRDLFGCSISPGTILSHVGACAAELIETELKIKKKLRRASVIHTDETGLRVEQKCRYVHVASTARLTHYACDVRRGRGAIDEIDILPRYRGTCVHDGWLAYTSYPHCRHSLCCAHLLRELTFFAELSEESKRWAEPLRKLLVEIKAEVEQSREDGHDRLAEGRRVALTLCYEQLISEGLAANPPPEGQDLVGRQARNLLSRMQRRSDEVLRFMVDFTVPFDNNQAERDLRMIKLQQKVSGCFRTQAGAANFCRIRSYLSTMRKQGKPVLKALQSACQERPLSLTS
jgi:transposase